MPEEVWKCEACGGGTRRGGKCTLCEVLNSSQAPDGHRPDGWPMTSEAAAVRVDQIPQAAARARKLGVPTEYNQAGQPVFTSRQHRKRYLHAHHLRDNSGGYGD
jgi:hypothetical protein